ncbi:MAG: MBOAT family protein [Lachnospiraceae bacterium]|nr:MBOAT family protein [Lachnospiraceae bacterium]
MYFSSMIFLWLFLPITLFIYLLARHIGKISWGNTVLVLASILFYSWGEPVYIFLLIFSVAVNYFFGLLLGTKKYHNRWIVTGAFVFNIGLLGIFKYYDFFADCGNKILGKEIFQLRELALPLGISFYTFQIMSYVIDVYRKEVDVQKNFLHLLLYVSLFPQLVAGPIVKYKDIQAQILEREENYEKRVYGIKRFIYGLGKKVLLSNVLGKYVDAVLELPLEQISTGLMWLTMVMYAFQIYYDFSGYSDMAIGLGAMFGFNFKENFSYPYIAKSIREFWRRWHISLSTWFREYVYIPLGGNRKGEVRTYLNLGIVFFLTGFWHGAGLNFIVWGLFHGLFMILERIGFGKLLDKNPIKLINHLYVCLVVFCGWVFFRVEDLRGGCVILKNLFWYQKGEYGLQSCFNMEIAVILLVSVLLCGVFQEIVPKLKEIILDKTRIYALEMAVLFLIFILCTISLASDTYNPFIYFRF